MPSIFDRMRLRPSQLRTVADRRFADARHLCDSRRNERANGAMYLGGFVIECLLKAALLQRHPWLQNASYPRDRGPKDRRLWSLTYRSHDLSELLAALPAIRQRLAQAEPLHGPRLLTILENVCAQWTIFARYSPRMADIADARDFIDKVEEIRRWLK